MYFNRTHLLEESNYCAIKSKKFFLRDEHFRGFVPPAIARHERAGLKFQYPMNKTFLDETLFGVSNFGHWDLPAPFNNKRVVLMKMGVGNPVALPHLHVFCPYNSLRPY